MKRQELKENKEASQNLIQASQNEHTRKNKLQNKRYNANSINNNNSNFNNISNNNNRLCIWRRRTNKKSYAGKVSNRGGNKRRAGIIE